MGGGVAVDSGNDSGIAALLASVDMLATNAAEMMVCVIGHHDSTPGSFNELMLLNGKPVAVGEGCIALLLKRLDDAKRDGNKIYGTISSGNRSAECAAQSTAPATVPATENKDLPFNAGGIDFGGISPILPLFSSLSSAEKNFSYSIFNPLFSNTTTTMNTSLTQNIERLSRSIIHFDATAKRRERLRRSTPLVREPEPVSVPKPDAVLPKDVRGSLKPLPSIDRSEVEEFCINYVIEQTEYPREMISVDEPLPDLGIDSIKKAQMFGELAECFDVKPREDIKFEDILTLRQIINIVIEG
jgi:acyl carrier protein